jgi:ribosomal protein S18 acetylase RimI-like enzyme
VSQLDRQRGDTKVRVAQAGDAARIAEIHVHAWQMAYHGILPQSVLDNLSLQKRQAFWEKRLASKDATVLVAVSSAELVGWLVYGESRDDDAASGVLEIYGLYVDPRAWRSGVGQRLWLEVRQRLASPTIHEVTLWVLVANAQARAFYESMGFRPEPDRVKQFERDGAVLEEIRYRIRF